MSALSLKIRWVRKFTLSTALLFVGAGSLGVLAVPASAAPRAIAVVLGRVVVKRKNLSTTTTLQANDKLYPGDIVVSGGASGASVRFNDGSRVDMDGRSVLEITAPTSVGSGRTLFRALNGRMAAHLRPGKIVATRTALVRVKGTVILISVEDNGTSTLSVLEGAAEFFNPCGSVIVPAGAQSVVQPGNAPTSPTAIPDVQALLRGWQNQNDVLTPFLKPTVGPANAPGALTFPVGVNPDALLPDYLQSAAARLQAIPESNRLIFIQSLASIQQKNKLATTDKDCDCGG